MSKPIEAVYVAFGSRVRMMREALSLTQDELRKRMPIARATLANVETGHQRILLDDVEEYAKALGTSPKALLKGIWW